MASHAPSFISPLFSISLVNLVCVISSFCMYVRWGGPPKLPKYVKRPLWSAQNILGVGIAFEIIVILFIFIPAVAAIGRLYPAIGYFEGKDETELFVLYKTFVLSSSQYGWYKATLFCASAALVLNIVELAWISRSTVYLQVAPPLVTDEIEG